MNKQRAELRREAVTIMLSGGFAEASADHFGPFWRVYGKLVNDNEYVGTTHKQIDPQDPRDLARRLVTQLAKPAPEIERDGYESAEAITSEQPAFAPEDDPFGAPLAPPPEPAQTPVHEGDGETGAEAEGGGSSEAVDERLREDFALDADFTDDLGAEILDEHPEHASGAFIFGDNLEQQRTAAIGIVVRLSLAKQSEIAALMGDADFAAIQGAILRDTVDGFYRGPQATYDQFVELSRHQSAINRIKAAEANKVSFLNTATRQELEEFKPEAGWPE